MPPPKKKTWDSLWSHQPKKKNQKTETETKAKEKKKEKKKGERTPDHPYEFQCKEKLEKRRWSDAG